VILASEQYDKCGADAGRQLRHSEDLPYIFERFYQSDKMRTRGGAGLGLAIARRIVELHGRTIRTDSAPGRGTTFAFDLPARMARRIPLRCLFTKCYDVLLMFINNKNCKYFHSLFWRILQFEVHQDVSCKLELITSGSNHDSMGSLQPGPDAKRQCLRVCRLTGQ